MTAASVGDGVYARTAIRPSGASAISTGLSESSVVTPLVGIRAIETDRDHLYFALRATPRGLMKALQAVREVR